MTIENNGPAPAQDTASLLFGMDGVEVTEAEREAGGRLTVWARIVLPPACPGCRTVSGRVHQYVTKRPRDVRACGQDTDFFLVSRRMVCAEQDCGTKTFTESVPQVPPRCSITRRLLEHAGSEVAGRGITPAEAARDAGISWPSAHGAFTERAEEILRDEPAPVAHLGIDEHRRGRPRWRRDTGTGEYVQLADRWHVCFYDLDGNQGMLGQVEGRTADDTAYWLAGATPAWRDAVQVVAIDMCTIFASAVRRMLPRAKLAVDLFHVVQLAVKTVGDVRRRAIRELYGRRGKSGDPEYGIKSLLTRNVENLSPEQFDKVIDTLDASAEGQQIALAWIAKEKLRDALKLRARVTGSTPCERQVRGRLFSFYDWCARHEDVPELVTLANTIARWENEIVTAVITEVTNATSESLNRLAKLEARHAMASAIPRTSAAASASPAHAAPDARQPGSPARHEEYASRNTTTVKFEDPVLRRQRDLMPMSILPCLHPVPALPGALSRKQVVLPAVHGADDGAPPERPSARPRRLAAPAPAPFPLAGCPSRAWGASGPDSGKPADGLARRPAARSALGCLARLGRVPATAIGLTSRADPALDIAGLARQASPWCSPARAGVGSPEETRTAPTATVREPRPLARAIPERRTRSGRRLP